MNSQGILITTHLRKENKAINECLNLFQEYIDSETQSDQLVEMSLENELSLELEELKKKKLEFVPLPKPIDCIRFCKLSQNPESLVKRIISDLSQKKIKKTRFTQRILPINMVCSSNIPVIIQKLQQLIQDSQISDTSVPSSFKIILKIRFNTKFKDEKDVLLKKIANLVNEKHSVDLETGKNVILVYILQKNTYLGIVSDYFDHFTLNLESIPFDQK